MKNIKWIIAARLLVVTAFLLTGFSSCKIEEKEDLNAPSVDAMESSASVSELNNLVTGTLSGMRLDYDFYLDDCAIIGRDYYRFSSADPRFVSDLPGVGGASLDNNTF